ncbi:MAG: glycoside hydrolase family 5 protein, partial [Bacteroidales bacterium]
MKFFHLLVIFTITLTPLKTITAQTPVAAHGQLKIDGNQMLDEHNEPYQLTGMSLFWSNWQGKFYNYDVIKWLRDDWNVNVVRAAMGISPDDNSGYLDRPEMEKKKVIDVIEAAIDLGIYVVVDWHSHHAENETAEAQAFFEEIASTYGDYPNILYETYNEPETDWKTIKTYHESVISSIRTHDQNNIIILGTPFYSQNIDQATDNPVNGDNLCYALHYYAASHSFYNTVETVINKGYYVFVSEFGTCESTGDGYVDDENSDTWWDFLDQYGVSWCNWAVSDVDEAASIVKPGSSIYGNWSSNDLTESGTLVRDKLQSYETDPIPNDIPP